MAFPDPSYPTPLKRLDALSHEHLEAWFKNDGLTHPAYGGNKVRKVAALMRAAEARGTKRLLTFGAAGSHHVLTAAVFARAAGIECAALLTGQPRTDHAVDTLRAALGAGLQAFPAPTNLAAPAALARAFRQGDLLIPPGASNVLGASAYAAAVGEIKAQFEEIGGGPPDCFVVPLGTGGTTAGLWAGTVLHALPTKVLAVAILRNPLSRVTVQQLAAGILKDQQVDPDRLLAQTLEIDEDYIGEGYGFATPAGDRATALAENLGIELDPTYTAKAFARVLDLERRLRASGRSRRMRVVYWHTLSAVPLEPLLVGAPSWEELPRDLRAIFR